MKRNKIGLRKGERVRVSGSAQINTYPDLNLLNLNIESTYTQIQNRITHSMHVSISSPVYIRFDTNMPNKVTNNIHETYSNSIRETHKGVSCLGICMNR